MFYSQMTEVVREKVCLRSLERFASRLDEYLSLEPSLDKEKDAEAAASQGPPQEDQGKAPDPVIEDEQSNTIIKKKRALFTHDATALLDLTKAPGGNESGSESDNLSSGCKRGSSQTRIFPPHSQAPKIVISSASLSDGEIENQAGNVLAGKENNGNNGTITQVAESEEEVEVSSSDTEQPPNKVAKVVAALSAEESEEDEMVSGNIPITLKEKDLEQGGTKQKLTPELKEHETDTDSERTATLGTQTRGRKEKEAGKGDEKEVVNETDESQLKHHETDTNSQPAASFGRQKRGRKGKEAGKARGKDFVNETDESDVDSTPKASMRTRGQRQKADSSQSSIGERTVIAETETEEEVEDDTQDQPNNVRGLRKKQAKSAVSIASSRSTRSTRSMATSDLDSSKDSEISTPRKGTKLPAVRSAERITRSTSKRILIPVSQASTSKRGGKK